MPENDNVTPIRLGASSPIAPAEPPLAAAAMELLMARSLVSLLHDVYAQSDGTVIESIQTDMPGVLYDLLARVRRAEELVNSVPHDIPATPPID
jgi:hypothetical protein